MSAIDVLIGGTSVPIERESFEMLFENSIVRTRKPVVDALNNASIRFEKLVDLARTADIPYPLFFAPQATVAAQISRKTQTLLAGVSKNSFSINSRNPVRVSDIELIIKDILRKQQELKALEPALPDNRLVALLRKSKAPIAEQASQLRDHLSLALEDFRGAATKDAALELLISHLERQQVFVARSQRGFMPQNLPRGVSFSGLCVRDKKVPFVFLPSESTAGDLEPAGRTNFTVALLTVLMARGRFQAVSYRNSSSMTIEKIEYSIAEEFLMPAEQFQTVDVTTLDRVRSAADLYKVTPSAVTMRALRTGRITPEVADRYFSALANEFARREAKPRKPSKPVNAIRKYNGTEYTRRMLSHYDSGRISPANFCRIVCHNHIRPSQISDLSRSIRGPA